MKRLDAREKCKLLAATYIDACDKGSASDEGGSRSPFQSSGTSIHRRHRDLWEHGSYAALELAINALRVATTRRTSFTAFWRVYVLCNEKIYETAPHKRHGAEQGLTFVTAHVLKTTNRNIYVPADIVENAGWTSSDARAAARPRKLAA